MTSGPAVETLLRGTAPWFALYAVTFSASRFLGPKIFVGASQLKSADRSYWAASVASVLNCVLIVPMAWAACKEANFLAVNAPLTVSTALSTFCCHAMVGYTSYDMLPLLYHRKEWSGVTLYLVHHVCSLATWGLAATSGLTHSIVVPVLLLEATGPFVNLRWFLSTHGLKDTWLYLANGLAMFLSFFVLRVLFNWWIFFNRIALRHDDMMALPTHIMLLTYVLFPINLFLQLVWFQKIMNGILALVRGKGKKTKAN